MTAVQLVQGTNKLNKATIQNGRSGTGMKVEHIRRTYFKGTMMMQYFAVVKSQTEPKGYSTIITFMNVAKAETLPSLDTSTVRVRCSCFTADTLVMLANGTSVPIKNLVGKDEFFVFSYDLENKKPVIGRGHSARLTGMNQPIYKVTLDNGQSVCCTGDHRFLLSSGEYKETLELTEGVSLRAIYQKRYQGSFLCQGYKMIASLGNSYRMNHYLADDYNLENNVYKMSDGNVRHHKNYCPDDNDPTNIQRVTVEQHNQIHSVNISKRMKIKNPMFNIETIRKMVGTNKRIGNYLFNGDRFLINGKHIAKVLVEKGIHHWQSKEHSLKAAERMKALASNNLHPAQVLVANNQHYWQTEEHSNKVSEIQIQKSKNGLHNFQKPKSEAHKLKLSEHLKKYHAKRKEEKVLNHKVVSVEFCGYEDVYDLTVDKYHNFTIDVDSGMDCSSGIVVHNCPDFFFCYSYYNKVNNALAGGVLRSYTRKTKTRPERNPIHTPGVCKHLIRQFISMRNGKLVTGGSVI
jgi:hypothetical protein